LPGVRLWYLDTGGDGFPVVFLHANSATSAIWEPQLEYFAEKGFRGIAMDRRGWGNSVADPSTGEQPGSVAEDLDALLDALELAQVDLVGVAGGTFSALDYAAWRPNRVRCLVASASTGMIVDAEIADFIKRIAMPGWREPGLAVVREVSAGFRGANPDGTARWIELEEHAQQPGGEVALVRTPNTYEKLGLITAPVLALAAGADLLAPPSMMRLWAAHLRDATLEVIPEAGHAIAYEYPDEFNRIVEEFLVRDVD
jgi:pimeloyl-ACP methyl ester carboxylesterase